MEKKWKLLITTVVIITIIVLIIVIVLMMRRRGRSASPRGPMGPGGPVKCSAINVYRYSYHGVFTYTSTSTTPTTDKFTSDGVIFRVCPQNTPGTVPLYQMHNQNPIDWMDTLSSSEGTNQGYSLSGIIGYVWPPDPSNASRGLIPVYRFAAAATKNDDSDDVIGYVHKTSTNTSETGFQIENDGKPIFYALPPR